MIDAATIAAFLKLVPIALGFFAGYILGYIRQNPDAFEQGPID